MVKWIMILFATSCLISQTAMDVFSTLLVGAMIWMGIRWHQQSNRSHRLFYSVGIDWVFAVWFLIVGLGFLINGSPEAPWLMRMLEFKWVIIFYVMVSAIRFLNPGEEIVKPAAIIFGISCLYAVVIYFIGFDPLKENIYLTGEVFKRTGGLFSNPMTFAHLYALVFCWFLGYMLYAIQWREETWKYVFAAVIISGVSLILSFTRGVWIGMAIAAFLMTFMYRKRLGLFLLFVGTVAFGTMFQLWPSFQERMMFHMHEKTYDFERINIWKLNIEIWKDYPVLGIGYGENARRLPEYFERLQVPPDTLVSHAHNQYLHYLSGTGVLGLLCYLIVAAYFFILTIRVWRVASSRNIFHQGLLLGLIGAQCEFLVGGLTEANFEHSKVRFVVLFTWAMVVWLAYEYRILREKV
ncbi:MAG: hypothetical protein BroJett040_00870 [Oligoflexia bacterium]|nr:MAG: hypothetical protein BroJett040_00870 [Oligoflexia bacterium]